jgi:hypothetical protein
VVRRGPESPAGTEGLRALPCSRSVDLSRNEPDLRAFAPGSRSLSGRTTLASLLRDPGATGAWSSSRAQALRFEDESAASATLIAGQPGATLVRLAVTSIPDQDHGQSPPYTNEASVLISVPQFVLIQADGDLDRAIDRVLGLANHTLEVLGEARRTLDFIYSGVNLRTVWQVGFGEELPDQFDEGGFAEGKFIAATLHGGMRACATPPSSFMNTEFGGYAAGESGKRLMSAPVHVCPAIVARHPDTMAWMVKNRGKLFAGAERTTLYATIVGRAIGELLAHEIGHQLLGCETGPTGRALSCHDRIPDSLMNKAGERSFSERTGIVLKPGQYSAAGRDDFPGPGTYQDHGIEGINRLPPEGQAVLDRILPVPPALAPDPPCPPMELARIRAGD